MLKIKRILPILLVILLVGTRLINIGWGLPLPFHPDERNMAVAIQGLTCHLSPQNWNLQDCFNPHFFAYGQPPLYLAYLMIQVWHILSHTVGSISFDEATLALRLISAAASCGIALFILKIIEQFDFKDEWMRYVGILFALFTPIFIQFAHFGTTESVLMFFYTIIIYLSLLYWEKRIRLLNFIQVVGLITGLAVATKLSSIQFIALPSVAILLRTQGIRVKAIGGMLLISIVAVWAVIFSPHTVLSFQEFISSMHYESSVGLGSIIPFYTKQFVFSVPVVFQGINIFPYTLGLPLFFLSVGGFIFLPYSQKNNLLRVALLLVFIPNAFLFAKWTRFMAPVFPLLIIFAILFFYELFRFLPKIVIAGAAMVCIIPGVAFLSIYTNPDVREVASQWMIEHIPTRSEILSETANVVDIPIYPSTIRAVSFNFYDLDIDGALSPRLESYIRNSNYIVIPSRRIVFNQTCLVGPLYGYSNDRCMHLNSNYPKLNDYYARLFNGSLGYQKVAEFSSFPKIELFGLTIFEMNDEKAEETFTVFDHPVIRIYEKIAR